MTTSNLPVPESDAREYARALYDTYRQQYREYNETSYKFRHGRSDKTVTATKPIRTADILACEFVFGARPTLQSEKLAELIPFIAELHPAVREAFIDQCQRCARLNREKAMGLRKRAELLEKQADLFNQASINAMRTV
jgi:hypothetical protein